MEENQETVFFSKINKKIEVMKKGRFRNQIQQICETKHLED